MTCNDPHHLWYACTDACLNIVCRQNHWQMRTAAHAKLLILPMQASSASELEQVRSSAGLTRLESFRVDHCAQAFGVVLEGGRRPGTSGWKVAFSGDTRPCAAVVAAAQNADLLVHEVSGWLHSSSVSHQQQCSC